MIHGLIQLVAALAATVGVYLLLGLAPALVIVGTLVLVGSVTLEIMGSRRPTVPASPASPPPGAGELEGRRSRPVDPSASAPEEE